MSLFNPSSSTSPIVNLVKTVSYAAFFWVVFLWIIPSQIIKIDIYFDLDFEPSRYVGIVVLLLASLLNLWAGMIMGWFGGGTPLPLDCASELVIRGPYRMVSNPMAVGGICQAIGVGIILGSSLTIIYAILGAIFWHLLIRPIEEVDLEERFGMSYTDYKRKINNWIPTFT